jgi:hypothetical protein
MDLEKPPPTGAPLSFDRAEYVAAAPPLTCALCRGGLEERYFEANGQLACERCAAVLRSEGGERATHARFVRALAWGFGAAMVGGAGYAAVNEVTGYIGLVAIGVAWLVGQGVRRGSCGLGGLRFQLLAMALTWLAIAGSHLPAIAASLSADRLSPALVLECAWLAVRLPMLTIIERPISAVITAFALLEAWRSNTGGVPELRGPFPVGEPARALARG